MRTPKISSLHNPENTMIGGKRNVILTARETNGDIYLVEGIMPKGSIVPTHIHTAEDEIFHVLEGEVELTLGDEKLDGKAGDIIYLPREIKHGIRTKGEATARVLNYVIPGRNFEAFFRELHTLGIQSPSPEMIELASQYGISFL